MKGSSYYHGDLRRDLRGTARLAGNAGSWLVALLGIAFCALVVLVIGSQVIYIAWGVLHHVLGLG